MRPNSTGAGPKLLVGRCYKALGVLFAKTQTLNSPQRPVSQTACRKTNNLKVTIDLLLVEMTQLLVSAILVCLFASSSWQADAIYSPGGAMKLVTAKNFKQKILDSELPAIVEFYAPWSATSPPLFCAVNFSLALPPRSRCTELLVLLYSCSNS